MGVNEHIYKVVVDNSPTGLAFLGQKGEIIYANDLLSQILGVSALALPGWNIFDFFMPGSRQMLEKKFSTLLAGINGPITQDAVCKNRITGEEVWTNIRFSIEYDNELDRNFILAVVADIHELKTERDLLVYAKEEAEKLTKTKSDFLS